MIGVAGVMVEGERGGCGGGSGEKGGCCVLLDSLDDVDEKEN